MRVSGCGDISFPLPQQVHDFVRGIKVQDLVVGTQLTPVLGLPGIRWSEELD